MSIRNHTALCCRAVLRASCSPMMQAGWETGNLLLLFLTVNRGFSSVWIQQPPTCCPLCLGKNEWFSEEIWNQANVLVILIWESKALKCLIPFRWDKYMGFVTALTSVSRTPPFISGTIGVIWRVRLLVEGLQGHEADPRFVCEGHLHAYLHWSSQHGAVIGRGIIWHSQQSPKLPQAQERYQC